MNFEQGHGEASYVLPHGTKKAFLFLVDIIDHTDKVVNGKGGSFELDLRFCEKDVDYGKLGQNDKLGPYLVWHPAAD